MKKLIFIILAMVVVLSSVAAANISLYAVDTDYNTIDFRGNESYQTICTEDGVEITVGAKFSGSNVRYDLEIKNNSDKDFKFDADFITTYQGNCGTDSWNYAANKINNNSNLVQSTAAASTSEDDSTLAEAATAAVVVGALAIGAFALFNWFRNDDNDPPPKIEKPKKPEPPAKEPPKREPPRKDPPPRRVKPHEDSLLDDVLLMNYLDSESEAADTSVSRTDNLASEKIIGKGKSYSGYFYTNRNGGPDYKLVLDIPDSGKYDFTFKNSDSSGVYYSDSANSYYSSSDSATVTTDDSKIAVALGFNILDSYSNGSAYAMYLGDPLGCYGGFSFGIDSCDYSVSNSYFYDHSSGVITTGNGATVDKCRFTAMDSYRDDYFNLSGGLTVKIFPYTWLLGGCGVDLTYKNVYGKFQQYNSETGKYDDGTTCCLEDKSPYYVIAPEFGLNFAFSIFDIGFMARFPLNEAFELKCLLGLAF